MAGSLDDPDDLQKDKPRLEKTGRGLFRELMRVFESAEVEDYFKNGRWNDDLMRTDIVLIERHRKEAGAEEPPELEDVKMPEFKAAPMLNGVRLPGTLGAGIFGVTAAKPAEPIDDIQKDKPRMEKTGRALFRELLRVWKSAEYEDYYKVGKWNDEQMKIDIQIMDAHRGEAGAGQPPKLEDVKMPNIPVPLAGTSPLAALMIKRAVGAAVAVQVGAKAGVSLAGTTPAQRLATLLAARRGGGAKTPTVPLVGAPVVRSVGSTATKLATAPAVAGAVGGVNVASELRLITMFLQKWKLDALRSKVILARLSPLRRRYVIQNFKRTIMVGDGVSELDRFIRQCEATNSWGTQAATVVQNKTAALRTGVSAGISTGAKPKIGSTGGLVLPQQGVKRPAAQPMVGGPAKIARTVPMVSTGVAARGVPANIVRTTPMVRPGVAARGVPVRTTPMISTGMAARGVPAKVGRPMVSSAAAARGITVPVRQPPQQQQHQQWGKPAQQRLAQVRAQAQQPFGAGRPVGIVIPGLRQQPQQNWGRKPQNSG